MARLRAAPTEEQRARHREAQRRYRERFGSHNALGWRFDLRYRCRESIAHRARQALVKKNSERGKETKLRPKARQYWSDLELESSESEDEEDDDRW
jgi:hypothetical protein